MNTTNRLRTDAFRMLFVGISVFSLAACKKDANLITDTSIRDPIRATAQADAASGFTSSTKFDISFPVFISCANNGNGEDVLLEGTLHETYHLTINENAFHLKMIDNPQGISGTGSVTGDKYQATGETQEEINQSFTNGQFTDSYVNNFKIIGQGPGNNYLVHENYHITVNANGTITSNIDNFSIDCK